MAFNMHLRVPLIIGTVPLYSYPMSYQLMPDYSAGAMMPPQPSDAPTAPLLDPSVYYPPPPPPPPGGYGMPPVQAYAGYGSPHNAYETKNEPYPPPPATDGPTAAPSARKF